MDHIAVPAHAVPKRAPDAAPGMWSHWRGCPCALCGFTQLLPTYPWCAHSSITDDLSRFPGRARCHRGPVRRDWLERSEQEGGRNEGVLRTGLGLYDRRGWEASAGDTKPGRSHWFA